MSLLMSCWRTSGAWTALAGGLPVVIDLGEASGFRALRLLCLLLRGWVRQSRMKRFRDLELRR